MVDAELRESFALQDLMLDCEPVSLVGRPHRSNSFTRLRCAKHFDKAGDIQNH
jgi:hypothetical protein